MAALSWALKQRQAMNTLLTAVLRQFAQHACDLEAFSFYDISESFLQEAAAADS